MSIQSYVIFSRVCYRVGRNEINKAFWDQQNLICMSVLDITERDPTITMFKKSFLSWTWVIIDDKFIGEKNRDLPFFFEK